MRDPESLAEMVVLAIKAALAPVQAKQQALQDELAAIRVSLADRSNEQERSALRDRLTAMEIKAAQPAPVPDVGDIRDRLVALETRTAGPTAPEALLSATHDIGLLRERVGVLEVKAAIPLPGLPDVDLAGVLAPVQERIAGWEERVASIDAIVAGIAPSVTELRERVVAVETRAAMPVPSTVLTAERDAALVDLRDRLVVLETRTAGPTAPEALLSATQDIGGLRERVGILEAKAAMLPAHAPATDADGALVDLRARVTGLEAKAQADTVAQDVSGLRERVAVLETRAPVAGPVGADGRDGKDGAAGADGLGFDDMGVDFDGDRTVTFKFARGMQAKTFPVVLPYWKHQGIYQDSASYVPGDVVTWAGSQWHCGEATTSKPGEGSKAWTLIVKRGRDGKDGRDAPGALPVVSVGRPR